MARRLIPRPLPVLALVAAVLALHAWVASQMAQTVAAWSADAGMPERLQVAYVRELAPTRPAGPAAMPAPRVPPRPAPSAASPLAERAAPPLSPASSPLPAPEAPPEPVAEAEPQPTSDTVADPPVPAVAANAAAAAAAGASEPPGQAEAPGAAPAITTADTPGSAPPFVWPASTRLSYRLSGQYRGELQGRAQVEWVLAAPRYQVHLDVSVGLPMAPLYTRRMSSDGRLTAKGLQPERYDEVSKMAFRDRRHVRLQLDEAGVLLADGQRWTPAAAPGNDATASAVQDSASQFVQLSYLFTVRPGLLVPGQSIAFPLALPRRVEPWVYEVVGTQTQATPFGPIETFHVRPRRGTPRGNDLLAEAWFAPQLAYLPVRIRIEQDAEVYLDLVLDRPPELAAR